MTVEEFIIGCVILSVIICPILGLLGLGAGLMFLTVGKALGLSILCGLSGIPTAVFVTWLIKKFG